MNQDRRNRITDDVTSNESDLHVLIDGLTNGEHIKATWVNKERTLTVEGPVLLDGAVWCDRFIRWTDGDINPALTSLEVTHDEEVTVTRDDEAALHALIDSLEDGQEVTAEWRDEDGTMTLAGQAIPNDAQMVVRGFRSLALRFGDGILHSDLRSVTVRRRVVHRWERDGDE